MDTEAQRLRALQHANVIRTARANAKRGLREGRQRAADLLLDVPEWLKTATVAEFLTWTPGVGRVKANEILTKLYVRPNLPVGKASKMTRRSLAEALARFDTTKTGEFETPSVA